MKAWKKKTVGVLNDVEELINATFRASGASALDLFGDLDAETGAIVGGLMTVYKSTKDLAVTQARVLDQMDCQLKKLRSENEEMREIMKGMVKVVENTTKIQEEILKEIKK